VTALHEAAILDQTEAVEVLLQLGADIEAKTRHGETPLMLAAAWGNCDTVRLLLARRANIYHLSDLGDTALDVAELKERSETVEILRSFLAMIERKPK
jgi:uncharacterized protein